MNGTAFLNMVIVLAGAAVFLTVWFLGGRYLPEHHWLRKWTITSVKRRGLLETARMVGIVLLMCALVVLAIAYP
jgi:hypothetical protein